MVSLCVLSVHGLLCLPPHGCNPTDIKPKWIWNSNDRFGFNNAKYTMQTERIAQLNRHMDVKNTRNDMAVSNKIVTFAIQQSEA